MTPGMITQNFDKIVKRKETKVRLVIDQESMNHENLVKFLESDIKIQKVIILEEINAIIGALSFKKMDFVMLARIVNQSATRKLII